MASFEEVPVLDFSLSKDPKQKPQFLEDLKRALLKTGFLYLKNTAIDEKLVQDVIRLGKAFFDLPMEEKLRLEMKNGNYVLFPCTLPHPPPNSPPPSVSREIYPGRGTDLPADRSLVQPHTSWDTRA